MDSTTTTTSDCAPGVHALYLQIPGKPPAKSNQYRIVRYGRRIGLARTADCAAYESQVTTIAQRLVDQLKIEGPIFPREIDLQVWVVWHRTVDGRRRKDVENILKALHDGLTGLIWADDCQISDLHARRVADARGNEWVEVLVRSNGQASPLPKQKRSGGRNTAATAARS